MSRPVYLTRASAFLPNAPVANDEVERVLGQTGARPSRARAIVQRSNGIKARYYAVDPASGRSTHTNTQLTANAVRALLGDGFALGQIEVLACGTSTPDQLMPNHAVMVHGELGNPTCEAVATSGICIAGVNALKYAWLSIAAGQARSAIATGSELASSFIRAHHFRAESEAQLSALEKRPVLAFEKDFLRWMLSDGAGAVLLRDTPAPGRLSLRVEWIDQFSYAHQFEPCMYAGAEKTDDGRLVGWREFDGMQAVADRSVMAIKQDVRLLDHGIRTCTRQAFVDLLARRGLRLDQVQRFLPHYSSEYFREVLWEVMPDHWKIPRERWFTNLHSKGNVGAASMFLMLDELVNGGSLAAGDGVLCFVPESGRFSAAFVYLVAVAA